MAYLERSNSPGVIVLQIQYYIGLRLPCEGMGFSMDWKAES